MLEIKFEEKISLFEFVKYGMINGEKSIENFINLHKIYKNNKGKMIRIFQNSFSFDKLSFSLNNYDDNIEKNKIKINIIAAIGLNGELGYNNDLIWKIPKDLKRFKKLTENHFILMGRKTFESFNGKMLPNRIHIVISKTLKNIENKKDLYIFDNIDNAIDWINIYKSEYPEMNQKEMFCIGGSQIYNQILEYPTLNKLFITRIMTEYIGPVDVFFPKLDFNKFHIFNNELVKDKLIDYYFTDMVKFSNEIIEKQVLTTKIIKTLIMNSLLIKN